MLTESNPTWSYCHSTLLLAPPEKGTNDHNPSKSTFFFHPKPCLLSLQNWESLCSPTMSEWYWITTYVYPHGSKLCPLTATVRKSWTHTFKEHKFWNPNILYKLKNSSKFSFLVSINVHENNWWANISSHSLIKVHCKRISLANWITVLLKFLSIQIKSMGGKQPQFHKWTEKSQGCWMYLLRRKRFYWWFCILFDFCLWHLPLLQNIDGLNIQVTRLGCSLAFLNYSDKSCQSKSWQGCFHHFKIYRNYGRWCHWICRSEMFSVKYLLVLITF